MRLHLVRHGQTTWNKTGRFQGQNQVSLNAKGLQQAHNAATTLNTGETKFLYASPLARAMETAQIIGDRSGLVIIQLPLLMEMNLGKLDGITSLEMKRDYPNTFDLWRSDPSKVTMPGGESLNDLQSRMWRQLLELAQNHEGDEVIAVSHNFAISSTLCRILEIPLSNFHCLSIDLGSISTIEENDQTWNVTSLNKGFKFS